MYTSRRVIIGSIIGSNRVNNRVNSGSIPGQFGSKSGSISIEDGHASEAHLRLRSFQDCALFACKPPDARTRASCDLL